MRINVLGPVGVVGVEGRPVATGPHQRLVLALLAARPGETVPTAALADALWRDQLPRDPSGALQNIVSRLRGRLAQHGLEGITTGAGGYGLDEHVEVDHVEFERAVATARSLDGVDAIHAYDVALALWRGQAFSGCDGVEAIESLVHHLDELRSVATEERLVHVVHLDPHAALPELRALVRAQPTRERPRLLLMDALHRAGRRPDALHEYQAYRTVLRDELGLDPSERMQALELAILEDTVADHRPAAEARPIGIAVDRTPDGPLPRTGVFATGVIAARRTSFVGRDDDVRTITELLGGRRLVTLVGPGGAGKTSLATEVARGLDDRGARVVVVDLVEIRDAGDVAGHVATGLGDGGAHGGAWLDVARSALADRPVLVVLDNCEHVAHAAAVVVDDLLAALPTVTVLATSRVPLGVPGERVWRVDPLTVPAEGASWSAVLASAAGRVFVDRVAHLDARATPGDLDADVVGAICRRLDGLPLALELAAARVPALGLRHVAERLDQRFGLLASSSPTTSDHHRTLRSAIDWSVASLEPGEQALLARLSIFAGDVELDAIEAICHGAPVAPERVAATLAVLADHSLVVVSRPEPEERTGLRYRLLETIRDHGASLLAPDETEALDRRHREWYTAFAAQVGEGFLVRTDEWYRRLRAAFPNLRLAFRRSMERGDVSSALELATALRWAPFNTGHLYREHLEWIRSALHAARHAADPVPPVLLGRGLVAAGAAATLESRTSEALDMLGEADARLTASDDDEAMWCHMWLAAALADAGRHRDAVEQATAGLRLARRRGASTAIVYLANQHAESAVGAALLAGDAGAMPAARASYELALAIATSHGVEEGALRARHGLALAGAVDDPVAHLPACLDALDGWRRLGAGNRLVMGLTATTRAAVAAGDDATAAVLAVETLDVIDAVGWRQPLGRLVEAVTVLAARLGAWEEAAVLAGAASSRFATPRWYVPVHDPAVDRILATVEGTSTSEAGRHLPDDEVIALVRHVAALARA